jgi:glycosyltransferase involved in cell wall biosynthesis
MKIGYFCYNLSGIGPRVRAQNIINGIAECSEHEVSVLTSEPGKVSDAADIYPIRLKNITNTWKKTRRCFSDVDVVHVPINIYQVLFVRTAYRGPLVAGVGPGIQPEHRSRALGKLLEIDRIIKVYANDTRWEKYGYDTTVCMATIDRDVFYQYSKQRVRELRQEMGITADTTVLYVGKLTKAQGAHIIDQIAQKEADNDDIDFIVIGAGPLEDRFRGRDDLHFEGFVDNERTPDYYNVADVLAAPRRDDNTSNVGLESISCGTPVVTTAKGTIEELFKERGTYVWAERNPEDVLETIFELTTDEDFYREQVQRGFNTMSEMSLSLSSAIETHRRVYREVTGS